MRLDQLPNELIAHIGSFLSFKDNVQFSLCQKRIHAVLKRDGLLKPECKRLKFKTGAQPNCKFWLPDSTELSIGEEKRDPKFNSAVGQMINKFRKIEVIDLDGSMENVTEDVFKDLINTKTKLSSLSIFYKVAAVDPNIFISACKKFDKIDLGLTSLPTELLCDQVFIELMPHTSFALVNFGNNPLDGYSLTDRTLKALTDPLVKHCFGIRAIFTSFTIAGIKTLVKEVLKDEDLDVNYNLGILKFSEGRNVVHWMEEVAADPNCPFIIERDDPDLPARAMIPYTISLKDNNRRSMVINFAINLVEI